jgi:hypothetical protein
MTDTENGGADLPKPVQDALVELVIRGMHRGELSAAQTALVERGLAMVKEPVLMPVGPAVALAGPLKFTRREYFEVDEASRDNIQVDFGNAPQVDLGGTPPPAAPPATPPAPPTS